MVDLALEAALLDAAADPDPNPPVHLIRGTVTAVSVSAATATITWPSGTSVAGVPVACYPFPAVSDTVYVVEVGKTVFVSAVIQPAAGNGMTGMLTFTRSSAAPSGWLFCNGGAINAAHTALIALVGANTPDYRDRAPIGAGTSYTLGTQYGNTTIALTTTELPAHVHGMTHTHGISSGSNVSLTGGDRQEPGTSTSLVSGAASTSATVTQGTGSAFSLLHSSIAVNWLIHI